MYSLFPHTYQFNLLLRRKTLTLKKLEMEATTPSKVAENKNLERAKMPLSRSCQAVLFKVPQMAFTESQNHGIVWLERDLKNSSPSAMGMDAFHLTRQLKSKSPPA